MVGGLTTGRMLIGQGAIDACKIGEFLTSQLPSAKIDLLLSAEIAHLLQLH